MRIRNYILFSLFALTGNVFSQTDNCALGGCTLLTVGSGCFTTTYSSAGFTDSNQGCTAGNEDDDCWFRFVATATSHVVTVDGAANFDCVLGVFTDCSLTSATGGACTDVTAGDGIEVLTVTGLTIGNSYYICVHDFATGSGNFSICISDSQVNMSNGSTTTCNATFMDSGGSSANYSNNQNLVRTFCPSVAGQCTSIQFSSMNIETGYEYIYIYDGNSTLANQFAGSPYTGTTAPGPFTASTTNTSGCITVQFISDNVFTYSGWSAAISCGSCSTISPSAQDCGSLTAVCNDQAFAGNSSGSGNISELNPTNRGCLFEENQSSWYSFTATTGGTISLTISPSNGTDDYDFAIWGPYTSTISCPPTTAPLRCSWAAVGGNTGLGSGAVDLTEGSGGNGWVAPITAATNDNYILLVDNYSGSTQPFTLDWTLTGGATLGCVPLPIELVSFSAMQDKNKVKLLWSTVSETNNDYFTLEKSTDGIQFTAFGITDGAGNSQQTINYTGYDNTPVTGRNYYRLKQTDFDGNFKYSSISELDFTNGELLVNNIHPNPTSGAVEFDLISPEKGEVRIEVMDYLGRIVFSENVIIDSGKTSLQTELSSLANGVYSMKVTSENTGYSSISKVVKK